MCNLPHALLAEWPGSFMCHCGNTGVEQKMNKSQHTKLTLEKKILPPLLQGFKLATFWSRVRHSLKQAIPAPRGLTVSTEITKITVQIHCMKYLLEDRQALALSECPLNVQAWSSLQVHIYKFRFPQLGTLQWACCCSLDISALYKLSSPSLTKRKSQWNDIKEQWSVFIFSGPMMCSNKLLQASKPMMCLIP